MFNVARLQDDPELEQNLAEQIEHLTDLYAPQFFLDCLTIGVEEASIKLQAILEEGL